MESSCVLPPPLPYNAGVAKSKDTAPIDAGIAEMNYEQALAELESIIDKIESGEIGLEDSVRQYERGVLLRKHCEAILSRAEQRVVELTPSQDSARSDG